MTRGAGWALSLALHAGAALLLLRPGASPPPVVVDGIEIAIEPAAPEQAPEPEPVAEAVAAAPPEAVETPSPEAVAEAEPPPPEPEPLLAVAPPEPVVEAPPEEPIVALPEPPPPQPPRPVARATPRPAARPAAVATTQVAPSAASTAQASAPAAAPTPPANLSPTYLGALHAALQRHQRYPESARWRRSEGTPMVQFRLRRDGAVMEARLLRSSGDPELDAAALATIQRAAPLPPMPADYPAPERDFTIPLRFSLR